MKKYFKIIMISLVSILFLTSNNLHASARGFSGVHSFHSTRSYTYHPSNSYTPKYNYEPKKSYNYNNKSNYHSNDYNKKYRINRSQQKSGFFQSDFGRSLTRGVGYGAGWSIGSHIGNSLWHTMFGIGGNSYEGSNGQIMYQQPGYSGIFILIVIIAVSMLVWLLLKRRNRY